MKEYIIFAGVNGAGKSTLYQTENMFDLPRINMDEIVREFGSWKNLMDVFKAGKIAVQLINEYLEAGVSFNQETTLCGNSVTENIKRAKKLGYVIKIYYVGVATANVAKERVKQRVAAGGHGVSEKDIEKRYQESIEKLLQIIPLCDSVQIYDNTENFQEVISLKNGCCVSIAERCPEWCKPIIQAYGGNIKIENPTEEGTIDEWNEP